MSPLAWIRRRRERQASDEVVIPGLVHELRQPIMALDAGLRLLERELRDTVTTREGWHLATTQLARLNETLETYAQLVGSGAGPWGPFDVAPVLRRAVAQLRPRLERLGGRFALVIEDDVPRANGRANALLHAVVNLLGNAIDSLDESGGTGRLELRALRSGADPQIRVSDEGTGIGPDRQRHLFQPRYTTKPEGKGNGIGLTLSRRVMRASGGDLRLGADGDPLRRPWARTEFVVELLALSPAPAPAPAAGEPGWRIARWRALAGVTLVVAAAAGWIALERRFPAPERAAAAALPLPDAAVVATVDGTLERRSGEGTWDPVGAGDRLTADDTLRTAPSSKATLAIGDRSRIALSEATQVTVREITSAVQRLRLSRGRLSVDHQPDGARVIVVEAERGDAVARAGAARFSVLSTGISLAVATDEGVVRLQTGRGSVEVKEGEQSVAFRGAAPATPTPIPRALLLKVANAVEKGPSDLCAVVEGTVRPGTEVRIDGAPVDPGPDGRFSARVPRRRGATSVRVVTREPSGALGERRVPCAEVDPRLSDFAVRWGTQ